MFENRYVRRMFPWKMVIFQLAMLVYQMVTLHHFPSENYGRFPGEEAWQICCNKAASHLGRFLKNILKQMAGWWLTYPTEKYESQLGWLFPISQNMGKLQQLVLTLVLSWNVIVNFRVVYGGEIVVFWWCMARIDVRKWRCPNPRLGCLHSVQPVGKNAPFFVPKVVVLRFV